MYYRYVLSTKDITWGSVAEWSKATDLRSAPLQGGRGFKSHHCHKIFENFCTFWTLLNWMYYQYILTNILSMLFFNLHVQKTQSFSKNYNFYIQYEPLFNFSLNLYYLYFCTGWTLLNLMYYQYILTNNFSISFFNFHVQET